MGKSIVKPDHYTNNDFNDIVLQYIDLELVPPLQL